MGEGKGTDCTVQRNADDASSPKALDSLNADELAANGSPAAGALGEPQFEKPLGAGGAAAANGSALGGGSEPVLGGTSFSGGFSKARAAAVAPPMPDEKP